MTIILHRSVLCQTQVVQVCHHASHLPFQGSGTGNLMQINHPRSLFQEGPLTLHVERADGICSKPQLDHPEKTPLLRQPLACNAAHTRDLTVAICLQSVKQNNSTALPHRGLSMALKAVKNSNAT